MKITNLKIGVRLGAGFGLVLTLMVALALTGVSRMAQIQQSLDRIVNDNNAKIKSIGEMRRAVLSIAIATRNMALTDDEDQLARESDSIADDRDEYAAHIESLTARLGDEHGKEVLAKIEAARAEIDPLTDKVIGLLRENKRAEAAPLLSNEVRAAQRKWVSAMDEMVRYQESLADKAFSAAEKSYKIALILTLAITGVALLLGAGGAWVVSRSITRSLHEAVGVARRVADGDLSAEVTVKSKDETGQLMQALKDMNDSLVRIVSRVRSGTETMKTASGEIASGNLDLSSRTEQQASTLQETASSMEELTATVRQNADNAQQANQLALSASEVASKGSAVVGQVVDTMGSISGSAKKIEQIISVIDGIAFQTNILALNAAVEAARAGEQGRGFAVVASEVRSLAQRSAAAAKEIKVLITDSVSQVDAGTRLVDQAGATMHEILDSVRHVSDIVGEISAASREQSAGIEQVNLAIAQMDEAVQQNAALVEQAAASSDAMQHQAEALAHAVSVFRLDGATEPQQDEPQAAEASSQAARIVTLRRPEPAPMLAAANE
ncbi:methyl-accepting chemotaxis protein [Noviherbaspirillum sp. UKPF54]|uniref:methyl-accepting chemotaxis protein n=1 Tax=Noviherbaspirillum sp. UKPF54 TaxID=2601898 RepID=UPI0011B199E8|nr:methyl-accepting chemotaxis protein [Noviherbaspirillum sp. UKPF54]QDZ26931.1 HAMP domain-containing protein [Noviherbaspirillum sp. UKPF54]